MQIAELWAVLFVYETYESKVRYVGRTFDCRALKEEQMRKSRA